MLLSNFDSHSQIGLHQKMGSLVFESGDFDLLFKRREFGGPAGNFGANFGEFTTSGENLCSSCFAFF